MSHVLAAAREEVEGRERVPLRFRNIELEFRVCQLISQIEQCGGNEDVVLVDEVRSGPHFGCKPVLEEELRSFSIYSVQVERAYMRVHESVILNSSSELIGAWHEVMSVGGVGG